MVKFFTQKGTTLTDYIDFLKQDGKHGDELSVYLLTQMANLAIIIMTKLEYSLLVMDLWRMQNLCKFI